MFAQAVFPLIDALQAAAHAPLEYAEGAFHPLLTQAAV